MTMRTVLAAALLAAVVFVAGCNSEPTSDPANWSSGIRLWAPTPVTDGPDPNAIAYAGGVAMAWEMKDQCLDLAILRAYISSEGEIVKEAFLRGTGTVGRFDVPVLRYLAGIFGETEWRGSRYGLRRGLFDGWEALCKKPDPPPDKLKTGSPIPPTPTSPPPTGPTATPTPTPNPESQTYGYAKGRELASEMVEESVESCLDIQLLIRFVSYHYNEHLLKADYEEGLAETDPDWDDDASEMWPDIYAGWTDGLKGARGDFC